MTTISVFRFQEVTSVTTPHGEDLFLVYLGDRDRYAWTDGPGGVISAFYSTIDDAFDWLDDYARLTS